jgi:magnesium-transporting ATPase (P-type)
MVDNSDFKFELVGAEDEEEVRELTLHARKRGRQRNLDERKLSYVLRYGRKLWRTGICFHFLAAKDIPAADRRSEWANRLIGTSVLVSPQTGSVITVYRNPKALTAIKKKSKRRVRVVW